MGEGLEVRVTAEAPAGQPAGLAGLPSWTLDEGQLGDLELLLSGGYAPLHGFMTAAEAASVTATGTLPDGTPWPVPITLARAVRQYPAGRHPAAAPGPRGHPAGGARHPGTGRPPTGWSGWAGR